MVGPSTRFSSPVHRKRERLPRLLERTTSLTFLGIYGVAAVRRHIVCASVIPSCTDREKERETARVYEKQDRSMVDVAAPRPARADLVT